MKGIYEHIIDFEVLEIINKKYLLIADLSKYMEDPMHPIIYIKSPNKTSYKEVPYTPNVTNKFNSIDLDLNCDVVDLPDGVYNIIQSVAPNNQVYKSKIYLRTVFFEYRFNKAFLNLEFSDCPLKNDEKLFKKFIDIDLLITTAKTYSEECNDILALEFYNMANESLSKLELILNNCH